MNDSLFWKTAGAPQKVQDLDTEAVSVCLLRRPGSTISTVLLGMDPEDFTLGRDWIAYWLDPDVAVLSGYKDIAC